jgi:polar amino acid transport system substrate-binding protein
LSSNISMAQENNNALDRIQERGTLIWGADAEGGAPYIFPDPENPEKYIGFEVDLADAIAKKLGVKAVHKQNAWDGLVPALERGDFDIAMNGIEITDERKETILFSRPYYIYTEQLVVRKDENNIKDINDLKGKKVGTLSGTVAQDMLEDLGGVDVRIYPTQVEPYTDLAIGRIDAVLLDLPIAAFYGKPNPELKYAGEPMGEGLYGIAIRKEDEELKVKIDEILAELLRSGELKQIYEKWGLWNEAQDKLYEQMQVETGYTNANLEKSQRTSISIYFPALLKGAALTIIISVVSMALAVTLGLFISLIRLYGRAPFTSLATAYIEIYRGTPLLIQLYLLYYGLPNIGISLSPWLAAIIGLGMNYAAYEAEIYRAGISAIPKGQMEAALSLGMSRNLAIKRIILPQALRISLPGITNDFIALFKDSSLVSIIAMVELTKTYNILASSTLRYLELGLITAILYFGMSYPLSLLARRLENRLRNGKNITSSIHSGNGFIAIAKDNIKNKNHGIISSLFLKGRKGGI